MSDTTTENSWVEKVGAPAYTSIVEMVAALQCDYDRLEELRDLHQEYDDGAAGNWSDDQPEEAEELRELEEARGDLPDDATEEDARERILDDALSVEVRSGWVTLGEMMALGEFMILLTTGGPAARIVGELDRGEPYRAWLEVQDWGKAWTQYFPADQDVLLAYARCFHFE